MFDSVKKIIKKHNISVVLLDIDGTIKDLAYEHEVTLKSTLDKLCANRRIRKTMCLVISRMGMYFMKTGILPTNAKMQNNLIHIFSLLIGVKYEKIRALYFESYPREAIMFESITKVIEELSRICKVVFVTNNCQTIDMNSNGYKIECVDEPKKKLYSKIISDNGYDARTTLIVGDNFFDDYLPAIKLNTRVLLVNRYHSKLKAMLMKLFIKK